MKFHITRDTGLVVLDSNMLLMKNRIILSKLTYVGKVMAKSLPSNMCRRALTGNLSAKAKICSQNVKTGAGNFKFKT